MILYHGSNTDIKKIDLSRSKVGKDFGCGFYLTPDLQIAQKQACRRADIEGGTPLQLNWRPGSWKKNSLAFEKLFNMSITASSIQSYKTHQMGLSHKAMPICMISCAVNIILTYKYRIRTSFCHNAK
ncbi:MAG: DUF3990 domain-containing protein [Bacteroidales bacterium]|nr:DUF3990 domain-containing protein [Bacteroidales bacterium]